MNAQLKTTFNVEFVEDNYLIFEKGIYLAQKKFKKKLSNKEFAQLAVIKFSEMLVQLEQKS